MDASAHAYNNTAYMDAYVHSYNIAYLDPSAHAYFTP